jgi:ABC-type phosphate transport system substrate-binding protein
VRTRITRKTGLAAAGAIALSLGLLAPAAQADYGPSASDVVGVGGDTPQYDVDFGADGDVLGDGGYNGAGNVNKLITFDATGDANGRTGYLNGSTLAAPLLQNPTIVLRAGTNPVQRPSSTGAGIKAILADTGSPHKIDFVRSGRLPTAAEQATAGTDGFGYLHVVELGTETLQIVAANTTNAPAGLSPAELVGIYQGTYLHWNDLPGNSGGSTDAIIPLIAPSTSVINTTLLADLKAANGNTAITLGSNVKTVEQNDPTAITGLGASSVDAIVAFSQARLALWNSGYFHNPATAFPGGGALTPGVKALTATAPDGAAAYSSPLVHYILFRNTDASLAPWQPGSTKNWVQTLFSDPTGLPFFKKPAGQALLAAAGITPLYSDLGNVSAG